MSKLHPIYVALDGHQYSRAIKLASALPESNTLGKALLAHAYSKSGQRYMALLTLQKILGGSFCELNWEIENAIETILSTSDPSSAASGANTSSTVAAGSDAAASSSTSSKKGKKGKKKAAPSPKQQQQQQQQQQPPEAISPTKDDNNSVDILDSLQTQPSLPKDWEVLPPSTNAILDETTLGTLSVTLQSLKLFLTAYQLYSWASAAATTPLPTTSTNPIATEDILTKTFCLGLTVLAAPSKWTRDSRVEMETHILAHIQSVALQWARWSAQSITATPNSFSVPLATAWASQAALWQLQWLPSDDKRSMILPRLAESMALRLYQTPPTQSTMEGEVGGDKEATKTAQSAEVCLLALRTMEQQGKWAEMLSLLNECSSNDENSPSSTATSSDFGVAMTSYQVLTEKARVLCAAEKFKEAQTVYESLLATSCPDDWSCWKGHMECVTRLNDNDVQSTRNFIETVLEDQASRGGDVHPLRGPHLMKVELAAHLVRCNATDDANRSLQLAIQEYSALFAHRAVCAFSDLESYVQLLVTSTDSMNITESLLEYLDTMQTTNLAKENSENLSLKEEQARLRSYIFSIKMKHKILAHHTALQKKWFPDLTEMVNAWKTTLSMEPSNDGGVSQKEVKPGDDLMLLVVQQLLYRTPNDDGVQVTAAALLESAIEHSPDNSYLKMAAIHVYHNLNAISRSWELFQQMGIKHIQLDTCNFIILPLLMEGGLYNEAIDVSNALLRFQANTARDCGDYAGRAMEGAVLSKANEFMVFQRSKMNKSLTVLEAKGTILDAASLLATAVPRKKHDDDPIWKGGLGINHGIVGGEEDMSRATQMVAETNNPYAALSVVSWAANGGSVIDCEDLADNRDLSVYHYQILYKMPPPSKSQLAVDALRRGHVHCMLIRATLCLDATKGPKKGKVVKPTAQLEKRTESLLDCVAGIEEFVGQCTLAEGSNGECYKAMLLASVELCRVLSVINTGLPNLDQNDTLELREQRATEILQGPVLEQLKLAHVSCVPSVKSICSTTPNFLVPLFAIFKMCGRLCNTYGWGVRKRKTKRCAEAMAAAAGMLNAIIDKMLTEMKSLPESDEGASTGISLDWKSDISNLVDQSRLESTVELVVRAQARTRARVEPILQQMDEYLDSFDITDDQNDTK